MTAVLFPIVIAVGFALGYFGLAVVLVREQHLDNERHAADRRAFTAATSRQNELLDAFARQEVPR